MYHMNVLFLGDTPTRLSSKICIPHYVHLKLFYIKISVVVFCSLGKKKNLPTTTEFPKQCNISILSPLNIPGDCNMAIGHIGHDCEVACMINTF